MATIRPFRALRPAKERAAEVAALPYDVYSREEARREVEGRPCLFLNIDRPETQFPADQDIYAPCVYQKADAMLKSQEESGIYVQDEKDCYYIYELTMGTRTQTGLVACSSVDDYLSGTIRKHENTRRDKEEDRIRHVDACSAQTGPIFLAYRSRKEVRELLAEIRKTEPPEADFRSEDGIRHRGWKIEDGKTIERLTGCLQIWNTPILQTDITGQLRLWQYPGCAGRHIRITRGRKNSIISFPCCFRTMS